MPSQCQWWEGEATAQAFSSDTGDIHNSSEHFIGLQNTNGYACLCPATALWDRTMDSCAIGRMLPVSKKSRTANGALHMYGAISCKMPLVKHTYHGGVGIFRVEAAVSNSADSLHAWNRHIVRPHAQIP
ncbi:hypothetical protein HL42_2817 [Trichophyton rubrum]|nr:hypothetical protein HL42_2817 [Trichophyton rubrum]